MENTFNKYNHRHQEILAYLKGNISEAQKKKLESEMLQDEGLQNEKDFLQNLLFSLEYAEEYKDFHAKMLESLENKPRDSFFFSAKIWAAAAIFFFAIGLIWWKYQPNEVQNIWKEYHTSTLPTFEEIHAVGAMTNEEKRAMNFYAQKKYTEAIQEWDSLIANVPDNQSFILYQAKAYMELGKDFQAKVNLRKLCENSYQIYETEAHWNLALLFVKSQQNDSASVHLQYLINKPEVNHYQRAKELFAKIQRPI